MRERQRRSVGAERTDAFYQGAALAVARIGRKHPMVPNVTGYSPPAAVLTLVAVPKFCLRMAVVRLC
jgi:hypothetical protein